MKFLKLFLLCSLFFGIKNINAQKINHINSECQRIFYVNYNKMLRNKYLMRRYSIKLPNNLNQNLKKLQEIYTDKMYIIFPLDDTTFFFNSKFIYGYLTTYPDINAVLFNRNHFRIKLSDEEKQKYSEMIMEIEKQIPNDTYLELSKITDELNRDKFALTIPYRFEFFQDLFDENQRKRIDIINFLLWNVE